MLLDFGYLPKFVMLYFVFDFFSQKAENNRIKKSQLPKLNHFCTKIKSS